MVNIFRTFSLAAIGFLALSALQPASAAPNGLGDQMAANSYFPTRSQAAFGADVPEVKDGNLQNIMASTAATMNDISPAAGDSTAAPAQSSAPAVKQ